MAPRHHVLLIGIDAYRGAAQLGGCVNDIDAVQRLLIERAGIPEAHITRLVAPLPDAEEGGCGDPAEPPTLANLRASLQHLGSEAVGEGDRVFIYYSGHGTQRSGVDRNGRRFSREALVPVDWDADAERRFLFDWELNALIAAIAARRCAVTMVLDCCNSAGATRGLDANGRERFLPPEADLAGTDDAAPEMLRGVAAGLGRVTACQVVAACRDTERAREAAVGQAGALGLLTHALMFHLHAIDPAELGALRWGRIWRQVEADVRRANPYQSPWISGSFGRRVLGLGPDDDADPGFAVAPAGDRYELDVGELAGVTAGAELSVYGAAPLQFPPLGPADLAARAGAVRVVAARPSRCEAVAVAPFPLPPAPRARLVRAGQAAALRVALEPPDATLAAALAASPLVTLTPAPEAELVLRRRGDGAWALTDDVHGTGELAGEPALTRFPPDRPDLGRSLVEHYHTYVTPLRMARACRDLPSALSLWLLDCNGVTLTAANAQIANLPQLSAALAAPYAVAAGDLICFAVENQHDGELSVTLLDCAASGRVLLLGEARLQPGTRHRFWADEVVGRPFAASGPPGLTVDRIVAIGTTRTDVSLRALTTTTSFADLLAPTRGGDELRGATRGPQPERWTAAITAVRITARP